MRDLITYDVFTETPFLGNPLAIVMGAEGLDAAQMQVLAGELNLSETIFVLPPDDPSHTARVRIFFPKAEIDFAGHPTIGCAIHLSGLADRAGDATIEMVLEENAGPVPVTVRKDSGKVSAEFTAPRIPTQCGRMDDTGLTARALGLNPADIGNSVLPSAEVWQAGPSYLLVPVATLDALGRARPAGADWDQLTDQADTISAWLFAADGAHRYRARMFSPAGGTPEDPATGSAVVTFAGLLAHHGHCTMNGETRLRIIQGVEMGRRSEIHARVMMQGKDLFEVRIGGSAVQISTGRIRIPPGIAPLP